jgi:hypothetical protein
VAILPTNGSAVNEKSKQKVIEKLLRYLIEFNVYRIDRKTFHLPGLQSVSNEQIDKRTFEIVSAGDQLSFNISKQMTP